MRQLKPVIAEGVLTELIALYEKQGTEKAQEWIKKLKFVRLHIAQLSIENNDLREENDRVYLDLSLLEAAYTTMKRKYEKAEQDLKTLKENL